MNYQLKIDIQSYWHPGTGLGQGSSLDAVTHRAANNLPALPGRSVKGLLRDAVTSWEHFTDSTHQQLALSQQLFGSTADETDQSKISPGLLRVNDAVLADNIQQHLKADDSLLPGLYRRLYSTALEYETGTAREKSLRGMEVIVPLTLYAQLEEIPGRRQEIEAKQGSQVPKDWREGIQDALNLIDAVGAHRTRGLGRAVVSLEVQP